MSTEPTQETPADLNALCQAFFEGGAMTGRHQLQQMIYHGDVATLNRLAQYAREHEETKHLNFSCLYIQPNSPGLLQIPNLVLPGADFTKAQWRNVNCDGSDFSTTEEEKACFDNAVINKSKLQNTDFSEATFNGAAISDCDFTGAIFKNTQFKNAKFGGRKIIFKDANFEDADFEGASFTGVDLKEAKGLTIDQLIRCKHMPPYENLPPYIDASILRQMRKTNIASIARRIRFSGHDLDEDYHVPSTIWRSRT